MRRFGFLLFLLVFTSSNYAQNKMSELPIWDSHKNFLFTGDWLVKPVNTKTSLYYGAGKKDLILSNGLLKRVFRVQPNLACTDLVNLSNGQQLIRAIQPEAILTIDGKTYQVGGLHGQAEKAYLLPVWVDRLTTTDSDFHFVDFRIDEAKPFLQRPKKFWSPNQSNPSGKTICFQFNSSLPSLKYINVNVYYTLYDGIPLLTKWITVENRGSHSITINKLVNETLALVEEESAVVGSPEQMKNQHGIYVETNYAFNNAMRYDISDQTTHWLTDSSYTSQVNYNFQTPCVLQVYPEKVTAVELTPGSDYTSVRTNELLMDSYDRERRGLAIRKMYRTIAPWVTENPIFMHLVSKTDEEVIKAIDQCAATCYEALILSFGSHCNMEDSSALNISRWKKLAAYAHQHHIFIGGYSLFSSRKISDEDDVIDPISGKPDAAAFFGHAPCLGSKWGLTYLAKLKYFLVQTGFDLFENDGPYPGDVCASTKHPGHKNLDDSQWKQMELQKQFYHWCNEQGIYVNAPDWYFLDGTNKIAIGYREVNFSLSRAQQKILNRQNIYDGTWEKTPSMGWGFVPLTRYQGGGAEAVLEPLQAHLKDYEQLMIQYYGAGVQACYRGPRLYDSSTTKAVVTKTIQWYKNYREILNSEIIHLRRADGRDWDGILHVNPSLQIKGFVLLYNPLSEKITRIIQVPLHYTGITKFAMVAQQTKAPKKYLLDQNQHISLTVSIPAEGYTWLRIE